MKIINVIPITNIPKSHFQVFSYFTSQKISIGSLVLAPIHRRQTTSVVIKIQDLKKNKLFLRKKANYQLRPVTRVLSAKPILQIWQIKLAKWLANYYWCSLSLAFKIILPKSLRTRKSKLNFFNLSLRGSFATDRGRPKPSRLWSAKAEAIPVQGMNKLLQFADIPSSPPMTDPRNDTGQILHLVPDLSSLEKIIKIYKKKKIAIYHGNLLRREQFNAWQKIRSGQAKVIIGTRLACFAPFVNLKKIIIEQEESDNYKSWDQKPYYDARRVGEYLAQLHNAQIKYNSIVPSLCLSLRETSLASDEAISAKPKDKNLSISRSFLKNKKIKIIDIRDEQSASDKFIIFSNKVLKEIKKTLNRDGQVIFFHNRRGMARFLACKKCGFTPKCPNCDVSLVHHMNHDSTLQCHHCNYKINSPDLCENCGQTALLDFGAGTQKIEEQTKEFFSNVVVARLDSDVSAKQRLNTIKVFNEKKVNVLIGTQMILQAALPVVDLAVILNADSILNMPDFRASENAFQMFSRLVVQSKKIIIQTYNSTHFALNAILKNDPKDFYEQELASREKFFYPPFSNLIKLTYKHSSKYYSQSAAENLFKRLSSCVDNSNVQVLGPCPGFIPWIRNKYIFQIIIKLPLKSAKTKKALLSLVPGSWDVDVDPISLL